MEVSFSVSGISRRPSRTLKLTRFGDFRMAYVDEVFQPRLEQVGLSWLDDFGPHGGLLAFDFRGPILIIRNGARQLQNGDFRSKFNVLCESRVWSAQGQPTRFAWKINAPKRGESPMCKGSEELFKADNIGARLSSLDRFLCNVLCTERLATKSGVGLDEWILNQGIGKWQEMMTKSENQM